MTQGLVLPRCPAIFLLMINFPNIYVDHLRADMMNGLSVLLVGRGHVREGFLEEASPWAVST